MEREITIDRSGRLVIPKEVRDTHHLEAGTKLTLIDQEDQIVLVPKAQEARLVEKDGLLVISSPGSATVEDFDHRSLREERLDDIGGVK